MTANGSGELGARIRPAVAREVTAALGGRVEVPTLSGDRLDVKVPAGTSSGAKLRLRGRGVAGGDQYLVFKVTVPAGSVDERSRELVEEFAKRNPQTPRTGTGWG